MVDGLIGKKIGMTQVFTDTGVTVPVTVIEIEPNRVTQVRTLERDGYSAVQLGYGESRRLNKPQAGHVRNVARLKHLKEFKLEGDDVPELGAALDVSMFSRGETVDVVGVSKGKGFAGVVKRHGFAGGPKTHGQSDRHRAPGSVGAGSTPGRVYKGTKMAGHMGAERRTVQSLEVVDVDPERSVILVKGAVPGARNGIVMVRRAVKRPRAAGQ